MKKTRPYILNEVHWKEVKNTEFELAILPWGALEPHNYHLPYSTDNIETVSISSESAKIAWEKGARIIVLPHIPFGVNTGFSDLKLTMNLNPSTQMVILRDILQNLRNTGIKKLLIVNGHGGNNFNALIREMGAQFPDIFISVAHWFRAVDKENHFSHTGDHADEMETSLMLYLRPDLVLPLDEAGEGNAKEFRVSALKENWAWAERKWSKVTSDTGIGNPKNATREKGEKYFREVIQKLSQLMIELAQADLEDMYE